MSTWLPFIVIGVVSGSVYGLAASGLVLTYKTSGIFNFAHGSVAALAVFIFYFLHVQHHVPWGIAFVLSVAVLGPIMGIVLERLAVALEEVSDTQKIAATIGIVLVVLALGDLWFPQTPNIPAYLPTGTVTVGGVYIGYDQIVVVVVSTLATAGMYYFLRYTTLGIAMRGVVDDSNLLSMTGENPDWVRRWAWIIGSTFAALSGVLLAPSLSLNATILTLLVVQAFGAAAIGYFSSLPLTYAGALLIGILGALSTKWVTVVPSLAGLPAALPFIILFLVLLVTPRARLVKRRFAPVKSLPDAWQAPLRPRLAFSGGFLLLLCVIPVFAGSRQSVFSAALIDVILFLSLGLLIRNSGQVSLCQYGFAAVGAAAMAQLNTTAGLPWFVSVVLAGMVAVPAGALVAIPAIRISGVFLALATLGFGLFLQNMLYTQTWMFGPTTSGIPTRRPHLGSLPIGTDREFYYVILLFTLATIGVIMFIKEGRLGRVLRAMADSPLALETCGASVTVTRVLVFCVSSFLAGIAGALSVSLLRFAVGTQFNSFTSLTLVALLVIIASGAPWYAFLAAFGLDILPAYINLANIADYLQIVFGLSAVIFPALFTRMKTVGMPVSLRKQIDALDRAIGGGRADSGRRALPVAAVSDSAAQAREASQPVVAGARASGIGRAGLEIRDLSVYYGGAAAVRDLNLKAPVAAITGLIGPNGAGKTTTFNACCGLVKLSSGQVLLHGEDVSGEGPASRARRGLGRTFQRVELFEGLSVRANVAMGREALLAGSNPVRLMFAGRSDRQTVDHAVQDAAEFTGIGTLLDRMVPELSTGERRLVEIARVLAGPFDLLLLDEPSSGLDQQETTRLGQILREAVVTRGIGILLVEHDMSLVRQICDSVYVLDFGHLIFEGTPAAMVSSEIVKTAYLGAEAVEDGSLVPDISERELES